MKPDNNNPPIFTTMGMFIIDTIEPHFSSNAPIQEDIIGGGGTYATLGARIIGTSRHSNQISWIVDQGSDFPSGIKMYLDSWGTNLIWRSDSSRLTTRGWNGYVDDSGTRHFKYLTTKRQISINDIKNEGDLINSRTFHLICSPCRVKEIVTTIREYHKKQPIIAWEPVPDFCTPENLQELISVLPLIDIFTPNAEEAARLLNKEEPKYKDSLAELAQSYLPHLTRKNSIIVLRCGALGCYTSNPSKEKKHGPGQGNWFPAYHQITPEKVKDPTGGGNTFIGSFLTGYFLSEGDSQIASICGNLGAGVAVEQVGFPEFVEDLTRGDLWNGIALKERILKYFQVLNIDNDGLGNINGLKDRIYNLLI